MQPAQAQFHCGNPPPAADPRRRICIGLSDCCVRPPRGLLGGFGLLGAGVHVDFHADRRFEELRLDPGHDIHPLAKTLRTRRALRRCGKGS
ncbi:hypothetical protein BVG79_02157 [Ketogulonicigenium robustum]|uniref:Uncharacterized protein n=1 Tax=Ketogulonicigenium robustum TaxID=92947 RepID=A0A1W6P2H8_9RHOB|nr:hypothetical protein BVG79_02157 [Ketogulonicigenium robustum]